MTTPVRHNLQQKSMRIQAEIVSASIDAEEASLGAVASSLRTAALYVRHAVELLNRKPVQKLKDRGLPL